MSIEQVNQFYQVVSQNPDLQLQFQLATDEERLATMAVEVGQQHGYSFTAEEVMQAIALAQSPTDTTGMVELADEQLEAVAGGKAIGDRLGDAVATTVGAVSGTFHAAGEAISGKNPDVGKLMDQHANALRPYARDTVKARFWPFV